MFLILIVTNLGDLQNYFDRYNNRSKIGCVTRHNSRAKRWMRCRSRLRHLLRCTLRWVWLLLYKNFTLLCSLRMEAWLRSLENVKLKLTSLSHAIVLKVVNLKQFMFELKIEFHNLLRNKKMIDMDNTRGIYFRARNLVDWNYYIVFVPTYGPEWFCIFHIVSFPDTSPTPISFIHLITLLEILADMEEEHLGSFLLL